MRPPWKKKYFDGSQTSAADEEYLVKEILWHSNFINKLKTALSESFDWKVFFLCSKSLFPFLSVCKPFSLFPFFIFLIFQSYFSSSETLVFISTYLHPFHIRVSYEYVSWNPAISQPVKTKRVLQLRGNIFDDKSKFRNIHQQNRPMSSLHSKCLSSWNKIFFNLLNWKFRTRMLMVIYIQWLCISVNICCTSMVDAFVAGVKSVRLMNAQKQQQTEMFNFISTRLIQTTQRKQKNHNS